MNKQKIDLMPDVREIYGWLEATIAIAAIFSVTALYVVGHIWRLPPPIMQLVDTTAIFSMSFPALAAIFLTGLAFRVSSAVFEISTERHWLVVYICDLSRFLAALACFAFFCNYHLGLGFREFGFVILAIPLVALCVNIFDTEYKKAHREIIQDIREKKSQLQTWTVEGGKIETVQAGNIAIEALRSKRSKLGIALLWLIGFTCGDLRMENLYQNNEVQTRSVHAATDGGISITRDVSNLILRTSDGVIFATQTKQSELAAYKDYCPHAAKERLSGRKCVLFEFVSNGRMPEISRSSFTNFWILSVASEVSDGVGNAIGQIGFSRWFD